MWERYDPLAQLVEHLTFNQGVDGSSPSWVTISGPLVKRSRHRPFTAITGVRFPHGSPLRGISSAGRAPALQAGCRRFDPVIPHHFVNAQFMRPSSLAVRMPPCHGGGRRFKSDLGRHSILNASVAQSVEQRTENPRVDSSILS